MKQITPEIKAQVFALYWGQSIINAEGLYKLKRMDELNPIREGDFLEVKPLSAISDEDAIEVAKILGFYKNYSYTVPIIDFMLGVFKTQGIRHDASDYLRSKSYALPAFGFSVDELVEAGIFKLSREK